MGVGVGVGVGVSVSVCGGGVVCAWAGESEILVKFYEKPCVYQPATFPI